MLDYENSSAAPNSDPRKCVWFAWHSLVPGMRQVAGGFSIDTSARRQFLAW